MSTARLNPLRDEDWSTASSQRAPPSSRQLQTRAHQQERRPPTHNPQHRTTTTVMRQTTVRQLHRQPFVTNGSNSNSNSNSSSSNNNSYNGGSSSSSSNYSYNRQLVRQQPPLPHPRGDSAIYFSHRPPPYSSQSAHSRQAGIASSSDPRFTAQDWKNWIKAQGDNNSRRPAPRTIITTKSTQSKGRAPASPVARLVIKSAPTSASPVPSPSSGKSIGSPSFRTASGARSPPSVSNPFGEGAGSLASVTSKPPIVVEVEDLLAGPAVTDSPAKEEPLPQAMADLLDLDFSITIASKHSDGTQDYLFESEDTKDLGEILKARDDLDHPWKQVQEDRIDLTSQAKHEVELIDLSDDVHPSVPITAVESDHSLVTVPRAAVQKDDSSTGASFTTIQNDDLAVSTSTIVTPGSNPPTGPLTATVHSERGERDSYTGSDSTNSDLNSDSDTDSDDSEDGHEDPWTILDNGGILVRLKSLEEVKSELDRACYAWEDVLARIKI